MAWDLPGEEADQDLAKEEFPLALDSQDEFPLEELPLEDEIDNPDAEGTEIERVNKQDSFIGRWFGINGGI